MGCFGCPKPAWLRRSQTVGSTPAALPSHSHIEAPFAAMWCSATGRKAWIEHWNPWERRLMMPHAYSTIPPSKKASRKYWPINDNEGLFCSLMGLLFHLKGWLRRVTTFVVTFGNWDRNIMFKPRMNHTCSWYRFKGCMKIPTRPTSAGGTVDSSIWMMSESACRSSNLEATRGTELNTGGNPLKIWYILKWIWVVGKSEKTMDQEVID